MNKLAQVPIGDTFLGTGSKLAEPTSVSLYVTAIITGAISIAGIILLFILIGGGIAMIKGAGKSDPKSVEQGKQAATSALIGFIVVFSAYWIVKLIETITGLNLLGI
jgi:hypothetical protein